LIDGRSLMDFNISLTNLTYQFVREHPASELTCIAINSTYSDFVAFALGSLALSYLFSYLSRVANWRLKSGEVKLFKLAHLPRSMAWVMKLNVDKIDTVDVNVFEILSEISQKVVVVRALQLWLNLIALRVI
jgi:hypothetical protein